MQTYRLIPLQDKPIADYIASTINKAIHWLARKTAENKVKYTNKAYYGSEMFGAVIVFSSTEKDDINKKMPKGNKMNHAVLLKHQIFIITPESLRKKNTLEIY